MAKLFTRLCGSSHLGQSIATNTLLGMLVYNKTCYFEKLKVFFAAKDETRTIKLYLFLPRLSNMLCVTSKLRKMVTKGHLSHDN